MKHKGKLLRRIKTIGYRNCDPTRDKDFDGDPLTNGVAFVQISKCRKYTQEVNGVTKRFYDAKEAPAIPLKYGGTYYGYGKARLISGRHGRYFNVNGDQVWENEYITIPMYLAEDGKVYMATMHHRICEAHKSIIAELGNKISAENLQWHKEREENRLKEREEEVNDASETG
jgi:hypothetical protein